MPLSVAQQAELIAGASASDRSWKVELVDPDVITRVVEDITESVISGDISRDCAADVHGVCHLVLGQELDWDAAHIKVTVKLTSDGVEGEWPYGVYVLTTPEKNAAGLYEVFGFDRIMLLNRPIGDSYTIDAGTTVINGLATIINRMDAAPLVTTSDELSAELEHDMVWMLDESHQYSWLGAANDVLASIGYMPLWVDAEGWIRGDPRAVVLGDRAPLWTFDLSDTATQIVQDDIQDSFDAYDQTNWWRFIQRNRTEAPSEGDGFYTVDDSGGGDQIRKLVWLSASDQATLETQGDAIVAEHEIAKRTITIRCAPVPTLWHYDPVNLIMDGRTLRCRVLSFQHYIGSTEDMALTLDVIS